MCRTLPSPATRQPAMGEIAVAIRRGARALRRPLRTGDAPGQGGVEPRDDDVRREHQAPRLCGGRQVRTPRRRALPLQRCAGWPGLSKPQSPTVEELTSASTTRSLYMASFLVDPRKRQPPRRARSSVRGWLLQQPQCRCRSCRARAGSGPCGRRQKDVASCGPSVASAPCAATTE
jgi:hypothetical protein